MVVNKITKNFKEFDSIDVFAVAAFVTAAVAETAQITNLYGYDLTQSVGGVSLLTVPVFIMVGSIVAVFVTNSLTLENVTDYESVEFTGVAAGGIVPLLSSWEPTFYTSRLNDPLMIILVLVGAAGIVVLSSQRSV